MSALRRSSVVCYALLLLLCSCSDSAPGSVGAAFGLAAPQLLEMGAAEQDRFLAAVAAAGVRSVRVDFLWSRIEPKEGSFAFGFYDGLVARASKHDIDVLPILAYGNRWADAAHEEHAPPDDLQKFGSFVRSTVEHFAGKVSAWEVWNEENFYQFWKPHPDPVRYAALLAVAHSAVKKADDGAKVVFGGLAPSIGLMTRGESWRFMLDAHGARSDLAQQFEVGAFHGYSFFQRPPPEEDDGSYKESLARMMRSFGDVLGRVGAAQKPIWITEIGWHTATQSSGYAGFPAGVSEEQQAQYLVRAYALALAAGAERIYWYTLVDGPKGKTDKEDAFGLFRYSADHSSLPPAKPAMGAYRTMSRTLGELRFCRDLRKELGLTAKQYGLLFAGGGRRVYLLWQTDGSARRTFPLAGISRGIDVAGDAVAGVKSSGATVSIPLSPSPVYAIADQAGGCGG